MVHQAKGTLIRKSGERGGKGKKKIALRFTIFFLLVGVFKYIGNGVGEMGEWFALAKDLSSDPKALWRFTTICSSISRGPTALFWLPQALHLLGVLR